MQQQKRPELAEITQHSVPSQTSEMAFTRLLHHLVLALEYTTDIDAHMGL